MNDPYTMLPDPLLERYSPFLRDSSRQPAVGGGPLQPLVLAVCGGLWSLMEVVAVVAVVMVVAVVAMAWWRDSVVVFCVIYQSLDKPAQPHVRLRLKHKCWPASYLSLLPLLHFLCWMFLIVDQFGFVRLGVLNKCMVA